MHMHGLSVMVCVSETHHLCQNVRVLTYMLHNHLIQTRYIFVRFHTKYALYKRMYFYTMLVVCFTFATYHKITSHYSIVRFCMVSYVCTFLYDYVQPNALYDFIQLYVLYKFKQFVSFI